MAVLASNGPLMCCSGCSGDVEFVVHTMFRQHLADLSEALKVGCYSARNAENTITL
jgi:hypothetical protein